MNVTRAKCVIVMDQSLPVGLTANTAAILALTLGRRVDTIVGPDVADGSGAVHAGITTVPVPILKAESEAIKDIRLRGSKQEGLLLVDFTDAAQTTKTYEDYTEKVSSVPSDELKYLGVALYGDKKVVDRLTGSLPLLR